MGYGKVPNSEYEEMEAIKGCDWEDQSRFEQDCTESCWLGDLDTKLVLRAQFNFCS
jgi:hypothetical protein